MDFKEDAARWAKEHAEEAKELLRTLGKIPAPSWDEGRRSAFVLDWLQKLGAEGAHIDSKSNVVYPYGIKEGERYAVVMAHMDIVQPDTEPLPMREEGDILYCPGIGDDTANLVCMLMTVKYLLENHVVLPRGILFAADTGEEGLGNLKGCWQIFNDHEGKIDSFLSFDGYSDAVVDRAVGSSRYHITCHTLGGHSYFNYGNRSAIADMADLICRLYEIPVPTEAKTTCNVGTIQGGNSVNSIASSCEILYEYRSESKECQQKMEDEFKKVIEDARSKAAEVTVETLGIRPTGVAADQEAQKRYSTAAGAILQDVTGNAPRYTSGSTDANVPLSLGIPSVTMGAIVGNLLHTRNEWMSLSSLVPGMEIAIRAVATLADLQF